MTAKYYSTPLVKVGNSSSIFTSNIYLSDASNVGSYGLELVVSGKPSNVSYSYTAANVAGFSVSAYSGVAGFSSSADVGGVFASTGVLIGSVTVTFATAPLALPKLVVLDTNLNLEDIAGVPIAVSYAEANNTLPSNALPIGLPLILGVVTENQTLTANTAGVSDADGLGALGYQWQRSANGTDWVNIELATQVTYLLGDADAAKQVRVQVSYTDGGGTAEVVRSAATTVVNVNDLPTGSVTISGTAAQGQTLTASNTLADADGLGTISYQWRAGGTAISGATENTYLLSSAEVGKTITVAASYTDARGTLESVLSGLTSVVAGIQTATGAKYYTTPLVKVGNSSSIFTSNIYLSDATNVGSYGLELGVSGNPGNVSLSYTATNVSGFTSLAGVGIAGFSNSFDASGNSLGGIFPSAGVSIGSVLVSFSTAPTVPPKLIVVSADLEDVDSHAIAVTVTTGSVVDSQLTIPASTEFSAALPEGLFDDTGIQGALTYSVSWAHGSEFYGTLGSWLHFDSATLRFSGTPSQAAIGYYPISITAVNAENQSVTKYASISVYNPIDGSMDIKGVGSTNPPDWGLTTKPDPLAVDRTSPVISKSGPSDKSVGIAPDAVLYFRFSEEVQRGTGDIRLLHGTDLVETFHVDTSDQLTLIYGATLKLTPSRPMLAGTDYTVEFDTQAFKDKAGNALADGQHVTFSTYGASASQRIVVDASDSQGREYLFFSEHSRQGAGLMQGGDGWDCYWIDSLQDRVIDTGTDPKDYDWVSYSFTPAIIDMAFFPNIESWRLKGEVTGPITFRGNELGNEGTATSFNDTLYGFGGSDQLDGGGGADSMYGGLGDDVFLIDNLGDKAYESSGEGFDIAYVNGVVGYRFNYDTEIEAVYVGEGASEAL